MGNYFKSIKENTSIEPLLHTHIMLSMMVEKEKEDTSRNCRSFGWGPIGHVQLLTISVNLTNLALSNI